MIMENNTTLGALRRREQNGVPKAKGSKTDLNALFESHIRDDKNRTVTGLDGRFKFVVPLLSSDECLDICKIILDGADAEWDQVQKYRALSVADVKAAVAAGDDETIVSVFGDMDSDEEIEHVLVKYRQSKRHIQSRDDAVDSLHRAMMIDTALRDVRNNPDVSTEKIAWMMDNSTLVEVGTWIEAMNVQVGLDRYIQSQAISDDENGGEKKK